MYLRAWANNQVVKWLSDQLIEWGSGQLMDWGSEQVSKWESDWVRKLASEQVRRGLSKRVYTAGRGTVMGVFNDLICWVTIVHISIEVIFFSRQKLVPRVLHSPKTIQISDLGIIFNWIRKFQYRFNPFSTNCFLSFSLPSENWL